MIDSIKGGLIFADEDSAVVDVAGVRFRLEIPLSTFKAFEGATGDVSVYTRLNFNANDGQFLLFGFATESERECFDIFTRISGIGPRKGLMILSQIEIAAFSRAVVNNDLAYLSRIKGVGKKTAERLVIELREKMAPFATLDAGSALPGSSNVRDAVEALVVLGCKPVVAEAAIKQAIEELGEHAKTEDLIRTGLRYR